MDNLSRAQNKENEIKIENLKGTFSGFEKHSLDTEKELKATIEQFTDLINYHINNKSNPHAVTSEQVTIISDPSPYQDASYSGDEYPMGISSFPLLTGSVGYPSQYGECLNVKTTKYRFAQFFFHAGNRNDPRIYLRHWYPSTGWTEFITVPSASDVDSAFAEAKAYTDSHANQKNNPHSVTKAQVGLSNVDNVKQAAKMDFDKHESDNTRHITDNERNKWNAGQLYKITDDSGKIFYKGSAETTDYNTLTQTGMYLIYNEGVNAPPAPSRVFLLVMSLGNTLVQIAWESYYGTQSFFRFRKSDSTTWTPWQTQETTVGAQEKADKVLNDAKAYTDTHAKNKIMHISDSERTQWNSGQLYKITGDNGNRSKLPDGTDLLTLSTGFYYAQGHLVQNNPAPNDSNWFNYDVVETGMGRKTFLVWRSSDNTLWHSTTHNDGVFKGWKKVLTDSDMLATWNTVTLINGAKQDSTYPLKFSVVNNVLWLRGTFGSLPAIGTSVAKFANAPTQLVDLVVPTVGSYGTARFAYTPEGYLRYDGINANDPASVTRVSFNLGVPLW
ncbi:pyocin knob domain-containing protein [Bacillus swezeyi]|uniref:pyocin knob domain-containing protein n=1 Tax=Bacillus swezeyi TaxID=1925020 RepID=UPI002E21FE5F|nr:pyocin knob domain-containing protein [Bacillus swezeyi]MED2979707.1 pyocin knob domain-containing protein [Bacillus swezeyi]